VSLTKKQREQLKNKYNGKCAYCGCDLPDKGWHADHIEPVMRVSEQDEEAAKRGVWKLKATGEHLTEGRDVIENMNPACAPCNLFKMTYSIDMFRKQIEAQIERARKSSVNFRTAERFGLIEIIDKPVKFYFEEFDLIESTQNPGKFRCRYF